jgi:hypothetical protein
MYKNSEEHTKDTGKGRDGNECTASVRSTVDTPVARDPGNQSKKPGQGATRTPKAKTHTA